MEITFGHSTLLNAFRKGWIIVREDGSLTLCFFVIIIFWYLLCRIMLLILSNCITWPLSTSYFHIYIHQSPRVNQKVFAKAYFFFLK